MSSFNKQIWEQATLALAEEYLNSAINEAVLSKEEGKVLRARTVLGAIIPDGIPNQTLAKLVQTRLVTKVEGLLNKELDFLIEELSTS